MKARVKKLGINPYVADWVNVNRLYDVVAGPFTASDGARYFRIYIDKRRSDFIVFKYGSPSIGGDGGERELLDDDVVAADDDAYDRAMGIL